MKLFICHSGDFDYVTKLYEPLRASLELREHELYLPHEGGKQVKTKDVIESSDLVIAEISYPSTGQGIELGWADAAGIPIIAIYQANSDYSRSVKYIAVQMIEYRDIDEMVRNIAGAINSHHVLKSQ